MKSYRQPQKLAATRVNDLNHRFKDLNSAANTLLLQPRSQSLMANVTDVGVIEERHRLAREIHDTLVQEFAGILLHLEAANCSDGAVNLCECLGRVRDLAKCGLENA